LSQSTVETTPKTSWRPVTTSPRLTGWISPSSTFSDKRPEYYRDEAERDAENVAEKLIEDVVGSSENAEPVGRVGTPATEILDLAEEIDAKYIVTGGRRRSPVGKAVFGSDGQEILLSSTVPVVTVMGPTNAPE
jgi:nucleotide-binding universal stress UspA family protein